VSKQLTQGCCPMETWSPSSNSKCANHWTTESHRYVE